jgi:guanylate kinase
LKNRASDSAAEINKRLAVARQEIAHWRHFDYLLVSESVEKDLGRALAIVEAEKMRAARSVAPEF